MYGCRVLLPESLESDLPGNSTLNNILTPSKTHMEHCRALLSVLVRHESFVDIVTVGDACSLQVLQ
jgi:hypothetical protein